MPTYADIIMQYMLHHGASYPNEVLRDNPVLNRPHLIRTWRKLLKQKKIRLTKTGFYVTNKYRMYRHAKRLVDTHSVNPKNRWDSEKMDLELTCEGTAPMRCTMAEVDAVVNPKMVTAALKALAREGIMLVGPGDVGFGFTDWNVTGSQWLGEVRKVHAPRWEVEIKFVNNVAAHYTWRTHFYARVKEFVRAD